jgi:hypothetical protein
VVEGWRITATGLGSVTDMVIKGILPWCLTPELRQSEAAFNERTLAFLRRHSAGR